MTSLSVQSALGDLKLAARLAVRELRGGLSGFYVLVICILLGVAAITTVGVLSAALRTGLQDQGRVLLGGDLSFSLVHRAPDERQRRFISQFGHISEVATLRSISRSVDGHRAVLVDIRAVDRAWPLTGNLVTNEGIGRDILKKGNNAIVDRLLLARLGIGIGDSFNLGKARITVMATIASEPDRLSGRLNFGPRVLISRQTLRETGLIRPGSLIRYSLRLLLDRGQGRSNERLHTIAARVKAKFPEAGFRILDRTNPTPAISRAIDRFSSFLALISLAALFIGGVGVANAVNSHIARKRETIATFKSLGASGRVIFFIYLLQILIMAGIGIVLGLGLGLALPPAIFSLLAERLPVHTGFSVPLPTLALATLYGLLVALIFILWPLGQSRKIRAAELYRAQISKREGHPGWPIVLLIVGLVAVLAAIVILTSKVRFVSLLVCTGFMIMYFAFAGIAFLLKKGFAKLPRPRRNSLALVRASLAGPTPLLQTIVLSLGIGLGLLATVSLVHHALVAELETGLPADAPNFFVLDIDKSDLSGFGDTARAIVPGVKINTAPMLHGRLVRLAGKPAEQIKPSAGTAWVLRGDRGLTFSPHVPKGSVVTNGKWWPEDYNGPPLVSFEEKIAEGLGLHLGDMITVNVLGRNISARIANLRKVKWESLSINFVMIFSPDTLQNAPFKIMATMRLPGQGDSAREGRLVTALVNKYPDITPIAVREVLAAVDRILNTVLAAIRAASLVLLLVGAVALAGAMAAAQSERQKETVIFKVLGATRRRILLVHLLEYLVLALICTGLALLFGGLAAWAIVTFAMEMSFSFSPVVAAEIFALVVLLVLPPGLVGSWHLLGRSTTAQLRHA